VTRHVVTLDELLDRGTAAARARAARRGALEAAGAGLYWAGWALFRLVRLLLLVVGGVFWAIGWFAARAVWPALKWSAAAVRLGWEDARAGRAG
jgi:hypothetical protein